MVTRWFKIYLLKITTKPNRQISTSLVGVNGVLVLFSLQDLYNP